MQKKKTKKINIKTIKEKKPLPKPTETKTAPTVLNPWDVIETMDKLFWDDPWTPFWNRRRWGGLIPRQNWYNQMFDTDTKITAVDMTDNGKEYKITAEMPGVNKKDIEVNITENYIKICGETKTETKEDDEGWIRRERSYSTICRTMPFPEEVNPNNADATLKDGILEITVGKKKSSVEKGRNIPVK
jgi:HSP20 family protein